MALVTHMLAHVVPRDARPFGATLLTVWLILSGQALDPALVVRRFIFAYAKISLLTGYKKNENQKQTHPARPYWSITGAQIWTYAQGKGSGVVWSNRIQQLN